MKSSPFSFLVPEKAGRGLLAFSILVFCFWAFVSFTDDIYRFALVGAIAEILWIPMILFLVFIPVVSIIRLFQKQAEAKMLSLLSLLIGVGSLIILFSRP